MIALTEFPNNKGANISFFINELYIIKDRLENIIIELEKIKEDEKNVQ